MALHQQMSQRCKYYQEDASRMAKRDAKPERQNCPKCGRDINGNLWSLWQHFVSMHPDNLDLLRNDVPRSWYENVTKGARRTRTRTPGPFRGQAGTGQEGGPMKTGPIPRGPSSRKDHVKQEMARSPSREFPQLPSPPPRSRKRSVRLSEPKHETHLRSRSRHRRERRQRHHHSKRGCRGDSRSPPPDPAHKPLPDKGPDPPGPNPGSGGTLGIGGSGVGVANLLIHIGQALAAERQQK